MLSVSLQNFNENVQKSSKSLPLKEYPLCDIVCLGFYLHPLGQISRGNFLCCVWIILNDVLYWLRNTYCSNVVLATIDFRFIFLYKKIRNYTILGSFFLVTLYQNEWKVYSVQRKKNYADVPLFNLIRVNASKYAFRVPQYNGNICPLWRF